jgi:hypothetical protein
MSWQFHDATDPVPRHGVPFPTDWLAGWMRETHAHGRRRLGAVAAFHEQLRAFGATGSALVGGAWMGDDELREGVWRRGPLRPLADGSAGDQVWADGAGDMPGGWLEAVLHAYLSDPVRRAPADAPRLWRLEGDDSPGLMLDLSTAGRRTGWVLVCLSEAALPAMETLLAAPVLRWAVPVVSGLLRSEQFRVHWDTLSQVMVGHGDTDWSPHEGGDRPVNAQEVTHRVARVADEYARDAATTFEAATVCILVPDPEDEYVYGLGTAGCDRYAYDAGLDPRKPPVDGVAFGLSPSYVVGAAWDPAGSPVVVRDLPDREAMKTRYRDLGFDEASLREDSSQPAPMLGERYAHDAVRERAAQGPWVFTAQRLPRDLSPTRRNLVVRLQGRTTSSIWSCTQELGRTSRDRRIRMASLAQRIHGELCGLFAQGLQLWREGLREEVLRELGSQRSSRAVCQLLASWLSARAVSLYRLDGGALSLLDWSLPGPTPDLVFDPAHALLDTQELRLLHAPLYPRLHEVSPEGFLGWPALHDAMDLDAENVGTVPITASGQPVGLLRVDGAMSLFGGLIRRSSDQGGLHHHRPTITPHHVRAVLEEMARILALTLGHPADRDDAWSDWSHWVERARRGHVPPEEVVVRLERLRAAARTRVQAAALVGVHRNTLRRQLAILADVLELDDVAW